MRSFDVRQEDLRAILNGLPAMVGYWDRNLRNRMANEAYVEYFGWHPDEMLGVHIRDVLGAELYEKNHPYMLKALAGEEQMFDRTIVDPSGAVRYTQASYIPDMVGSRARGFFVLVTDISARRRTEQALAAAERRFRTLFDLAPLGTFLLSSQGVIVDANRAAAEMLGTTRERLIGRSTQDITHPDDVDVSLRHRAALVTGEVDSYRIEKRYVREDGSTVWAQLDARLLPQGEEEGPVDVLAQVQDISHRRHQQEELERIALHDPLTGLLNRRGLLDELERSAARVRRYGGLDALLIVDLDNFKGVNDTYGHRAGDEALATIGGLLLGRLRESDVVARYGGDEFAVILGRATEDEAERVGADLATIIREARLGVPERPITASVGIAALDGHVTAADALAQADGAMYRVKRAGGDAVAGHVA